MGIELIKPETEGSRGRIPDDPLLKHIVGEKGDQLKGVMSFTGWEFEEWIEPTLTAEAEGMIAFHPDSPFHQERVALGIKADQVEKKFKIQVLDIADAEWKVKTGNPASFSFIPENDEDPIPVIFISKGTYRRLKERKDPWALQELLHEYRHTQRSWRDQSGRLFPILDEISADQTSARVSRPYIAETLLIHWLCEIDERLNPEDIYRSYREGDVAQMEEFLENWRTVYSEEGLKLLAKIKPGSSAESMDVVGIWESLLALKERTDPNWLGKVKMGIRPESQKALNITFSGFFNRIIQAIERSDARRVKTFMEALQFSKKKV